MISKEKLDTIINDVTWSYEECGEKVPQEILDTLNEIKQIQNILNEYNVTSENIREILLTGQMFKNNSTLSECIKEWKERGFSINVSTTAIFITNSNTVNREEDEIDINIRLDKKTIFYVNDVELSFDLHNLLSKTLKALEVENSENSKKN